MPKVAQNELAKRIGKAVAQRRTAAQMTQERVAEKLGIGNEAYSRIERGVASLSVVRLFELSELFGCETADLLREGSMRIDDQACLISQSLTPLKETDRELVLQVVQQLSERLSR